MRFLDFIDLWAPALTGDQLNPKAKTKRRAAGKIMAQIRKWNLFGGHLNPNQAYAWGRQTLKHFYNVLPSTTSQSLTKRSARYWIGPPYVMHQIMLDHGRPHDQRKDFVAMHFASGCPITLASVAPTMVNVWHQCDLSSSQIRHHNTCQIRMAAPQGSLVSWESFS